MTLCEWDLGSWGLALVMSRGKEGSGIQINGNVELVRSSGKGSTDATEDTDDNRFARSNVHIDCMLRSRIMGCYMFP